MFWHGRLTELHVRAKFRHCSVCPNLQANSSDQQKITEQSLALPLHFDETSQPLFRKVGEGTLSMSPYSLLLSASHYEVLVKNAAPGSDAHSALMRVLPPTTNGHRVLMCNVRAIEELLDLAVRVCPDAVLEISRQIQNQMRT